MTECPDRKFKFHRRHGSNITLLEDGLVATRESSFANALTFSNRPLSPGEIFLIEIDENQLGWSGYMRIGLTQLDPNTDFELPLYALPDLINIGPTWAYAITKSHHMLESSEGVQAYDNQVEENVDSVLENIINDVRRNAKVIQREGSMFRTPKGLIHASKLLPSSTKSNDSGSLLPTDVGSKIGVMFVPTCETFANMHFIINGHDQGACCSEIPYKVGPLHAVVDVYGSTKTVRIIQTDHDVVSLQGLCRDTILRSIKLAGVSTLPLPKLLKDYLLSC